MSRVLALLTILVSGCLHDSLVNCDDGRQCAAGLVCTPSSCADPIDVAACAGKDDHAACETGGAPGECHDAVCIAAVCGNALVDLTIGEMCDDGNNVDRDGCSASCNSDEQCGNGVIDHSREENCDDGNISSLDGCASTCQPEPLTSRQLVSPATVAPSPRYLSAAAFDPARGVTVLFGGFNGNESMNDTWEYDGATWRPILTSPTPKKRFGHGMAYDPIRHRTVIFAGDGGGYLGDVWAFDGTIWTRLSTTGPVTRFGSIAIDSKRDRLIAFGGQGAAGTFEFSFTTNTWRQLATTTAPSERYGAAMTYDPMRDRIVLFGGTDGGARFDDTWELYDDDWHPITALVSPRPSGRINHVMVYDTVAQHVLMTQGSPTADTWRWTGSQWLAIPGAPNPERQIPAIAFDSRRGRAVVFGGLGVGALGDTWELDGGTWSQPAPLTPSPRYGHAVSYDSVRGAVVVFGGSTATGKANDTWELDGTWRERLPATRPPVRWDARTAFDPVRGTMVLFGGADGTSTFPYGDASGTRTLYGDTWEWDGTTWTQKLPAHSPSPRMAHAIAWDGDLGRIVLFGGWNGTETAGATLDDTWVWDGTDWTEISSATRPPGRYGSAMIYDEARQRVLLHAGWTDPGSGKPLNDTWELVGSTWTEVVTTGDVPVRRGDVGLTYDPIGKRALLVGGAAILGGGYNVFAEMWELRGSTWRELDPQQLPPGRAITSIAFDAKLGRTIVFGGDRNGSRVGDTWSIGFDAVVPSEVCASGLDLDGDTAIGCADSDCGFVCTGCNDGVCTTIEGCRLCPQDCGACTAVCGDGYCDAPETAASCPGDCP